MTRSDDREPEPLSMVESKAVQVAIKERMKRVQSEQDAVARTSHYPGKEDDLSKYDVELMRLRNARRKLKRGRR